jgi:hypothetical protein
LVLSDVGGDHSFDLAVFKQYSQSKVIEATVVRYNSEVLGTLLLESGNQMLRGSANTKTTDKAEARQEGNIIRHTNLRIIRAVCSIGVITGKSAERTSDCVQIYGGTRSTKDVNELRTPFGLVRNAASSSCRGGPKYLYEQEHLRDIGKIEKN